MKTGLEFKFLKVPSKLHARLKRLAKRDGITIWRVVAESVNLFELAYPEARTLDAPELRGRPKKEKHDILGDIKIENNV